MSVIAWAMEFENSPIVRDALDKTRKRLADEKDSQLWVRYGKTRLLVFVSRNYSLAPAMIFSIIGILVFLYLQWKIPAIVSTVVFCLIYYVWSAHFNYTVFRWSIERKGYKGKSVFLGQAEGFRRFLTWDRT